MVGMLQIFLGHTFEQGLLHRQRCRPRCQPGAIAHPENMGIHRHGRLAKRHIQHHIRRFAPHAGQGFQRFTAIGHLAIKTIEQNLAGLQQMLGLAAVQTNGLDVPLQAFQPQIQHRLRRIGHRKQLACGLVHPHICGLG